MKKQGNMSPPKVYNSPATDSTDIEVDEVLDT
jgi:hypothetical protein